MDSNDDTVGKRRERRKRVGIQGQYRTGSGVPRDVWVTDLSKTGCRFYDKFGTMQPGKALTLRLGTVGPIPAIVRWWDNHVNGIEFEQPLYDSVYHHICDNLSEEPTSDLDNWDAE